MLPRRGIEAPMPRRGAGAGVASAASGILPERLRTRPAGAPGSTSAEQIGTACRFISVARIPRNRAVPAPRPRAARLRASPPAAAM